MWSSLPIFGPWMGLMAVAQAFAAEAEAAGTLAVTALLLPSRHPSLAARALPISSPACDGFEYVCGRASAGF